MKQRHSCECRNPFINLYLGQINREMLRFVGHDNSACFRNFATVTN
jgi:hypothetical protein